jgi:hypothetical protein
MREMTYEIGIDLQRLVTPTDDTMLRQLSCVAQEIHDWFDDAHELVGPGLEDWTVMEASRDEVYFGDVLYSKKIWETLITVLVRGRRATV